MPQGEIVIKPKNYEFLRAKVTINGSKPMYAMIDTGSQINIINHANTKFFKANWCKEEMTLRGIGPNVYKDLTVCDADLVLEGRTMQPILLHQIQDTALGDQTLILGRPFLAANSLSVDHANRKLLHYNCAPSSHNDDF
jgi:hypothetical protein